MIKQKFEKLLKRKRDYAVVKRDLIQYNKMNTRKNFDYVENYKWFINEKAENAGTCRQYYWQDLWAASLILERKPMVHYDIGSRIDGFIGHLQSAKQRTVLIDVRPLPVNIPYVDFVCEDAKELKSIQDNSIKSLSALCSLEHFGLGRYGDPIDPEACFKAMKSIQRVISRGGYVYIAVPVGGEHLEFNAHRVFAPQTIVNEFSEMELLSFHVNSLDDNMTLEKVEDIHAFDFEYDNKGMRFGMFEFRKK